MTRRVPSPVLDRMTLAGLQVQLLLRDRPSRGRLAAVDHRHSEVRPANRAGDVGIEPGVDAVDVEDVETGIEESEGVVAGELGKADGALKRAALALPVSLRLREGHCGEGGEQGPVQATARGEAARCGTGGSGREVAGGSATAAAEVDGEESKEEEAADEGDDEGGHSGVDADVVTAEVFIFGSVGRRLGGREREDQDQDQEQQRDPRRGKRAVVRRRHQRNRMEEDK